MPSKISSSLVVVLCAFLGGLIGDYVAGSGWAVLLLLGIGLCVGAILVGFERVWVKAEPHKVLGGVIGALAGALLGLFLTAPLEKLSTHTDFVGAVSSLATLILSLLGVQLGAAKAWDLKKKADKLSDLKHKSLGILDTSVIIDGRIADVCETGFLSGELLIPQFILKELQMIADSSESMKRTRGRRGLDILNKMQKQSYVSIIIDETDYPSIKEVDLKLIRMAKETGYSILTNDFNLNKVAEVHSIRVLNINQLANALKPIVLPGETIRVQVMKEGKEPNQGVAYLDDGTMVVIDNGRRSMGRTVEITVTSVLQTTAGRMIFAALKN